MNGMFRRLSIKKLKLVLIFTFAVLTGAAFLHRGAERSAMGQSAGEVLEPPQGVSVTEGVYANKVGIYWEAVRSATVYRISRNVSNNSASATDVGTTSAFYFFDPTAVAGQTYFYWVRAENSQVNSPLSVPRFKAW